MYYTDLEARLIRFLRDYAEQNVIPYERIMRMANNLEEPIGDDPRHVIRVKHYRVVFSLEYQGKHVGNLRHASVTRDAEAPSIELKQFHEEIMEIFDLLGFSWEDPQLKTKTWEEDGTPYGRAFNVLQEVRGGRGN